MPSWLIPEPAFSDVMPKPIAILIMMQFVVEQKKHERIQHHEHKEKENYVLHFETSGPAFVNRAHMRTFAANPE